MEELPRSAQTIVSLLAPTCMINHMSARCENSSTVFLDGPVQPQTNKVIRATYYREGFGGDRGEAARRPVSRTNGGSFPLESIGW